MQRPIRGDAHHHFVVLRNRENTSLRRRFSRANCKLDDATSPKACRLSVPRNAAISNVRVEHPNRMTGAGSLRREGRD